MDAIEEILETVRAMRQTQLESVRRARRFKIIYGMFAAIVIAAYIWWSWFITTHVK